MSVWLTIPSKRPPEEAEKVLRLYRERGYKIALCVDSGPEMFDYSIADHVFAGPYQGYAKSVNFLIGWLIANEPGAEWFIAAGDDVEPDLNHSAEEIAAQCRGYFYDQQYCADNSDTFGVMQPTGDRWGDTPQSRQMFGADRGAYIDRVCGSAWIGREFARRINGGRGPLWPEYFHMFVDEELQNVAESYGVLWQRRDLIQLHQHWGRGEGGKMPEFLARANSREEWKKAKAIFDSRKAGNFPGSELLP